MISDTTNMQETVIRTGVHTKKNYKWETNTVREELNPGIKPWNAKTNRLQGTQQVNVI